MSAQCTTNNIIDQRGVIQRALELAREGQLKTVSEIQIALMREEYDLVAQHLAGQSIRRQLKATVKNSAQPK